MYFNNHISFCNIDVPCYSNISLTMDICIVPRFGHSQRTSQSILTCLCFLFLLKRSSKIRVRDQGIWCHSSHALQYWTFQIWLFLYPQEWEKWVEQLHYIETENKWIDQPWKNFLYRQGQHLKQQMLVLLSLNLKHAGDSLTNMYAGGRCRVECDRIVFEENLSIL